MMKKIADGIALLDLSLNLGDREMVIHPALLWDDKETILVDTGFPGMLSEIQSEMESVGVPFAHLSKVVLTHQDYDHIGGLPDILEAAEHPIEVYAHELDKPYIEGEKLLIKHDPARGKPPKAKVDKLIGDGDIVSVAGGFHIIFTPGHTPGHISLYHSETQTLITGDATVSEEGKLLGPNENFTPDLALAWQSIQKFTRFDIKTVLCYHGGVCDKDVKEQFAQLSRQHNG